MDDTQQKLRQHPIRLIVDRCHPDTEGPMPIESRATAMIAKESGTANMLAEEP
jgi:hypothetical protein